MAVVGVVLGKRRSAGAGTDPALPVTSGLVMWNKANAGVYADLAGTIPATTDGQKVYSWRDQSPNGVLLPGTNSQDTQPLYVPSRADLGGRPALNWLGSLQNSTWITPPGLGFSAATQSWTIIVVAGGPLPTSTSKGLFFSDHAFLAYESGRGFASKVGYHDYREAINYRASSPNILVLTNTGTTSPTLHINTVAEAVATNWSFTSTTTHRYIGVAPGAVNGKWGGYIAEIIVYNRAITAAERGDVEAYLKSKYGIA